jgi:pseudaminic acid synthase
MNSTVTINNTTIGTGNRTYIVAELSANHGGSYDKAEELIREASQAGANAVKLQTYTADTMTINCRKERFVHGPGSTWAGLSLYELYETAYTPWEWHPKLQKVANDLGLDLFSSPFDSSSVDFLNELNVPAFKIASFEIVDLPLIEYAASKNKPLVISTGMASIAEIDNAVKCARQAGCNDIILLKCVSSYPATYKDMNLYTIPHMQQTFQCPVGLSDHSRGIIAPVVAVSLGASIIEKHFTFSKSYSTPDQNFSLDPKEFSEMVLAIRNAEKCLGTVNYSRRDAEEESESFRRSLYITLDIEKGEILTADNCRSIRPGGGLNPKFLPIVMGKKIAQNVEQGTPLTWDLLIQ